MSLNRVLKIHEELFGKKKKKPIEFGSFDFQNKVFEIQQQLNGMRADLEEIEEALKAASMEVDIEISSDGL